MIRLKSILLVWVTCVLAFILSLTMFPDDQLKTASFLSYSLQLLLFILSLSIVRSEPTRKNRFIFVNFAFFFSISILFHFYNFIGEGKLFFSGDRFARLYFIQYISMGAYFFFLAFAIVYLALDALFRDFKTIHKYMISLAIVGSFFGLYYGPLISNANYLYTTPDAKDWVTVDKAAKDYFEISGTEATPEVIASMITLNSWKGEKAVGSLYPNENLTRIRELFPYLNGSNFIILFQKPLYLNTIYMCVLCLGFVLLFFGYQYLKDPPQGAYIEKIMFLLLIFCTMEILHAWSFVTSVEWQTFSDIMSLGQYLSTAILFLVAVFFSLRLKFITSVKGEFYEHELSVSPAQVTRWRDAFDNMVVNHFFNRKTLLGRLFVDPNHR